ncbi:MAG: phosphatidate cytidylyltransferase [Bacteroidales bacterium]|nr:phosphatidate cytidylyltransferase [Bacteroidales bacterium]
MKNIFVRSLSGSVYVSAITAALILGHWYFFAVCLLLNLVAIVEFRKFGQAGKKSVYVQLVLSCTGMLAAHFVFLGHIGHQWLFLSMLLPLTAFSAALYRKDEGLFSWLFFEIASYVYITLPLVILDYLYISLYDAYSWAILLVFVLIWANDTFAYLSGVLFGKHKLFERITPKKTWEGFFGGVIATVLLSWALFRFSGFDSLALWLLLGALVSVVSVFGDFTESMFKRAAGLKDSGNLIPGHGGVLDRIDSLLFVFPVVFVFFKLIIF